jgi:membrane-bound lytic murein transglycosylase A
VFGLRSADNNPNGLITGYYEPVYPGSLTQTATAMCRCMACRKT